MKINYGLETKLAQKMALTKELKQSLDILHMNKQELDELVMEETKENPLIEIDSKPEIDWEKFLNHIKSSTLKINKSFYEDPDDENNVENYIPYSITLEEHLEEEIALIKLEKDEIKIANQIISYIDNDGYFREDTEQFAQKFNFDLQEVEKILDIIQHFEPTGIGARNLEECLCIQIKEKNLNDETLIKIIQEDLVNLAKHKYKEIIKKYNIDENKLKIYLNIIKSLNPKPGRIFSEFTPIYILPDIIVEKIDGELVVRNNKESNISLSICKDYEMMLKSEIDDNTKKYLKSKFNSAANLMKAIEQRKNTIYKIATSIVEYQKDFFINGKKYLQPMKMKDIAEITGFHESTVSRTVNGKYMLTPYGLYEFKYFFSSNISEETGENLSNKIVKEKIKEIIFNENKKKPLSDSKICEMLSSQNIEISRRTVTKYREEMQIPSSTARKEI